MTAIDAAREAIDAIHREIHALHYDRNAALAVWSQQPSKENLEVFKRIDAELSTKLQDATMRKRDAAKNLENALIEFQRSCFQEKNNG